MVTRSGQHGSRCFTRKDAVYDTLHRSARLRAAAIFRRMQMTQTDPGPNWQSIARRDLNERLMELTAMLGELPLTSSD